jgi:hypothetical protein
MDSLLKKFLNPFCFAWVFYLAFVGLHKAKWAQLNGKTLQVLKKSLFITGKPRHVEVKLKCKKSESPSAVSIYLLEPKTCEYVLGVESPLVCDILASADEYGLMKVSSKSDFNTATTIPSSAGNLFLLCPKN